MRWLIILAFIVSGCASQAVPTSGNFLVNTPIVYTALVADAEQQLIRSFPPAKTRLVLRISPDRDTFGTLLLDKLRHDGYAIALYSPGQTNGLAMNYSLDKVGSLLRVQLTIGAELFSRAYNDTTYKPLGHWVKRSH